MIIFSCEEIILGGDFNLVRDATQDKKGGKLTTHRNSLKVIQNIRDNLKLTDILQMTQIFWESVTLFIEIFTQTKYQNNRTFGKTFLTINTTNLTKWIRKKCEGLLTEKECLEAVKSMESGKSPGTDGLPTEFDKVFWRDVSPFLISPFNKSYQKGKLAIT